MECYEDSVKDGQTSKKESPIDKALDTLKSAISRTQETKTKFETILASVLAQPEEPTECKDAERISAQTPLETHLKVMSDEVAEIDRYLNSIQNRIQL